MEVQRAGGGLTWHDDVPLPIPSRSQLRWPRFVRLRPASAAAGACSGIAVPPLTELPSVPPSYKFSRQTSCGIRPILPKNASGSMHTIGGVAGVCILGNSVFITVT